MKNRRSHPPTGPWGLQRRRGRISTPRTQLDLRAGRLISGNVERTFNAMHSVHWPMGMCIGMKGRRLHRQRARQALTVAETAHRSAELGSFGTVGTNVGQCSGHIGCNAGMCIGMWGGCRERGAFRPQCRPTGRRSLPRHRAVKWRYRTRLAANFSCSPASTAQ